MAATTGNRLSTDAILLDGINSERLFGFDGMIAELVKDQAPFITFLNKLGRKTVDDPDYKYTEYRGSYLSRPYAWIHSQTSADSGCDITSDLSTAAAGKVFNNINLVKLSTSTDGEADKATTVSVGQIIQIVTQSSSADTATGAVASFYVKAASTAAATYARFNLVLLTAAPGFNVTTNAGATRTKAYVVGNMYGEGSEAASSIVEGETIGWASAEIIKEAFTITETVKRLTLAGNKTEAMKQYKYALARLKAKFERRFMYASSRIGATTTNPYSAPATTLTDADGNTVRTSISLLQACKDASNRGMGESRVFNFTSASPYTTILTNMMNQFKYGSSVKWGFIGDGMLNNLKALMSATTYRPNMNLMATTYDEAFDLPVMKLETDCGIVNLVRDRTLTQDGFYTNTMFVVDPENIEFLEYRPVDLYSLPTTKDVEAKEFRAEMGLCVKLPETHGFWYVG